MSNTRKWIHEWKKQGPPPMVPWKFVEKQKSVDEVVDLNSPTLLEFHEQHLMDEFGFNCYSSDFDHYLPHMKPLHGLHLHEITPGIIVALHLKVGEQNKYVANQVVLMLRLVFKIARSAGCLPKNYQNPADDIKLYTVQEICDFKS